MIYLNENFFLPCYRQDLTRYKIEMNSHQKNVNKPIVSFTKNESNTRTYNEQDKETRQSAWLGENA